MYEEFGISRKIEELSEKVEEQVKEALKLFLK